MGRLAIVVLILIAATGVTAQASAPNWTGTYPPCNRHQDLLNRGPLDLGVRFSTSDPALARVFRHALEFWSSVLDLTWHEDNTTNCALQLVDGAPQLFDEAGACGCISARSQFPDRPDFQGWIAFNPAAKLTDDEMFRVSIHEIGHLLGLPHNPSGSSVMFFLGLEGSLRLDATDLNSLERSHTLRDGIADNGPIPIP
jgi:hypothetical protein